MNELMNVYTVCDTKAEAYLSPFVMRTDYEAQRAFEDSVNKPGTLIYDHPEDFCLFKIGTYSSTTGMITGGEHKSLGCGADFKKKGE